MIKDERVFDHEQVKRKRIRQEEVGNQIKQTSERNKGLKPSEMLGIAHYFLLGIIREV